MRYFYESHLGGVYSSEHELDWDDLYCDQCGDCDQPYADVEYGEDLLWFISRLHEDGYGNNYIREILDEYYTGINIYLPDVQPFYGHLEDYYCNRNMEIEDLRREYNEDERCLREIICGDDCIYNRDEFIPECHDCINTYEYALFTGNSKEFRTQILS